MKIDEKMKEMQEKIKGMEKETIRTFRELGYQVDMQARSRWLKDIEKVDGVSYEEACRMVIEEPQYSLGWKMCGCPIMKIALRKKEVARFRKILTPEEDKIFTEEVLKLKLSKIVKKEIKKQTKKQKA